MKEIQLCDLPEELLTKQIIIDTIPDVMILLMLFISTVVAIVWYIKAKDQLSVTYSRTFLIAIFIVFFPSYYKCSFIAKTVATNIFNSEYAALVVFSKGCPNSLR